MLKKLFLPLLAVLALGTSIISTPAYADVRCEEFLGMPSWDCNIDYENVSTQDGGLSKVIWGIVANIFVSITVIATYLAVGYVIYGGYQYIFSGGEVGKVASGKKTLNQAFIGLAIIMSANIIVNAIRIALLGGGQFTDCDPLNGGCGGMDADTMVMSAIDWVIGISGIVSVIFIIGGGITYMTSSGDAPKLQKAKNMIKYALIGLAIVALAFSITAFMRNVILKAQSGDTSYNIEKGFHNETTQIS